MNEETNPIKKEVTIFGINIFIDTRILTSDYDPRILQIIFTTPNEVGLYNGDNPLGWEGEPILDIPFGGQDVVSVYKADSNILEHVGDFTLQVDEEGRLNISEILDTNRENFE